MTHRAPILAAIFALSSPVTLVAQNVGDENFTEVDAVAQLEIDAAAAEARRRFPEFRAAFEAKAGGSFFVKHLFTEGDKSEHMWVEVQSIADDEIKGTLANDPRRVSAESVAGELTIATATLTDWFFQDGDEITHGQFSVPILRLRAELEERGDLENTYLIVGDVVPTLRDLLGRETVQRALATLPPDMLGGIPPVSLPAMLTMLAPQFPERIEFEGAPEFPTGVGQVGRVALALLAAEAAGRGEPAVRRQVGETLRAAMASLLHAPDLSGRLRLVMSDERAAEAMFDQALALVDAPPPGFDLEAEGEAVKGTLRLRETQIGTRIVRALRRVGLPRAVAEAHVVHANLLEVPFALTLKGSSLTLEFGTPPAPFAAAEAAKTAQGTQGMLMQSGYDVRGLVAHMSTCVEQLNAVYGDLYAAAPDFVDRLDTLEDRLGSTRPSGTVGVYFEGEQLRLLEEFGATEYETDSITTEQLWTVVPDDASFALLSGEDPLDFMAHTALGDLVFELQFATEMYDGFGRLEPVLEYLGGESSSVFYIGTALIGRKTSDGQRGYAVIGVPETPGEGLEFVRRVLGGVAGAVGGIEDGAAKISEFEVGNGVKGYRVEAASLGLAADAWPATFVPHYFAVRDFVVISTDVETSLAIAARIEDEDDTPLQGVDAPEAYTYFWRITGDEIEALFSGIAGAMNWVLTDAGLEHFYRFAGQNPEAGDTDLRDLLEDPEVVGPMLGEIEAVGRAVRELVERLDDAYVLEGARLRRTMTIKLRDA